MVGGTPAGMNQMDAQSLYRQLERVVGEKEVQKDAGHLANKVLIKVTGTGDTRTYHITKKRTVIDRLWGKVVQMIFGEKPKEYHLIDHIKVLQEQLNTISEQHPEDEKIKKLQAVIDTIAEKIGPKKREKALEELLTLIELKNPSKADVAKAGKLIREVFGNRDDLCPNANVQMCLGGDSDTRTKLGMLKEYLLAQIAGIHNLHINLLQHVEELINSPTAEPATKRKAQEWKKTLLSLKSPLEDDLKQLKAGTDQFSNIFLKLYADPLKVADECKKILKQVKGK